MIVHDELLLYVSEMDIMTGMARQLNNNTQNITIK
jgi:hypothetical protein